MPIAVPALGSAPVQQATRRGVWRRIARGGEAMVMQQQREGDECLSEEEQRRFLNVSKQVRRLSSSSDHQEIAFDFLQRA